MTIMSDYQNWCTNPYFDDQTKTELRNLSGQDAEIKDRFHKPLEFGTGGLRGIMGAGSNRMNIYTVRRATQGLADYILKSTAEERSVVIAYDSRYMSKEFADETACCFCANGIKTYVFEKPTPTPVLSFAVRELGCVAGVVITASHNPPKYNGYKVYWTDGAQITPPRDSDIMASVSKVNGYDVAKTISKEVAIRSGLYHTLSNEIEHSYLAEIRKLGLYQSKKKDIRIVYTPLHGTGGTLVLRVLDEIGYTNVWVVPEQANPDGRFPTVATPNPEEEAAFTLALALAERNNADIVLATDPDADRLGVGVRNADGKIVLLSGNMIGALLCDYLLKRSAEIGNVSPNSVVITTIVSGKMCQAIAKDYGVKFKETLTGFKYIGEQIRLLEEQGNEEFLFGYEESNGFLIGTYARDKDAVSAIMLLCEAATYYKDRGLSLWDRISELKKQYGYYQERLLTKTFEGEDGVRKINEIMKKIRSEPPHTLAGFSVRSVKDYATGVEMQMDTGISSALSLPCANVLYFELSDDAWCCMRPSGTEPKIKYYLGVRGNTDLSARKALDNLEETLRTIDMT